jgi:transposase
MTDEILNSMSPLFDAMYAEGGRPSIPPEKLLRAQLLQMLYSVRSAKINNANLRSHCRHSGKSYAIYVAQWRRHRSP